MSGRYSQLSRVFTILGRLEGAPHGLTVAEIFDRIKDEFRVDKRTVYRDLEALETLGFLIFPESGDREDGGAVWKINKTLKVGKTLNIGYRELIALYLAKGALAPLKDSPLYVDLETVFTRIETILGARSREYLAQLGSEIYFEPGPRWGLGIDPEVLDTVQATCEERQVLSVVYESGGGAKKSVRRLGPHFLYFAKGSLYLIAEDLYDKGLDGGQTKVFAVPRMTDAKMLDEEFKGERIDPEKYFSSVFGIYRGSGDNDVVSVKLEFSQPVASYVRERRWHPSQRVVSFASSEGGGARGGKVVLSLDVAITPELVQWVLGFGSHARVLEPERLAQEVLGAAGAVMELYGVSGGKKRRAA